MAKLRFQLVTPEKKVLEQELDSLSCPTPLGQITILPGHTQLVSVLSPGELITRIGGQESFLNVTGGVLEIKPDNRVIILADEAEHHYEIDEQRAEEARKRAVLALTEKHLGDEEYARTLASLDQSLSRLKIVRKHAHKSARPITGEGVLPEK